VTTPRSTEETCQLAPLFALGALETDEARAFERHLTGGCSACSAELADLAPVVADLAHAAAPRPPAPALRERVLGRIAALAAAGPEVAIEIQGVHFLRTDGIVWEPGSAAGVERKRLFTDAARNRTTTLIRVAPGASYPSHRHADIEEVYLLEGDLLVGGVLMRAGDYCRAEPDSVHEGVWSPSGCVFLATFSEHNQRLG
jgi:anti-sigma factor ChrR (cupin superfamily)